MPPRPLVQEYCVSNFIQVTPFMYVDNLERAVAFFTEILGFVFGQAIDARQEVKPKVRSNELPRISRRWRT